MIYAEHKAILKRLIEEAEYRIGIQTAFPYTSELLKAVDELDKLNGSNKLQAKDSPNNSPR